MRVTREPVNPTGVCMCGCGEKTAIATKTQLNRYIVKGQHHRYVKGHQRNHRPSQPLTPNPSGRCMCGCGAKTKLAKSTHVSLGRVKGEHLLYVAGHERKRPKKPARKRLSVRNWWEAGPNPAGLCFCGCGDKTRLAESCSNGNVRGTPLRYIKGHHNQSRALRAHRQRLASTNRTRGMQVRRERWAPVVEDYRRGLPHAEIEAKHELSKGYATHIVRCWREEIEPDLPRRQATQAAPILARLEREGRVSKKAVAKAKVTRLADHRADAEREAEIAALVAEQEDDAENGNFVANGTISLDKPIADGGSLHELLRKAA